jgi:hypothetical protein
MAQKTSPRPAWAGPGPIGLWRSGSGSPPETPPPPWSGSRSVHGAVRAGPSPGGRAPGSLGSRAWGRAGSRPCRAVVAALPRSLGSTHPPAGRVARSPGPLMPPHGGQPVAPTCCAGAYAAACAGGPRPSAGTRGAGRGAAASRALRGPADAPAAPLDPATWPSQALLAAISGMGEERPHPRASGEGAPGCCGACRLRPSVGRPTLVRAATGLLVQSGTSLVRAPGRLTGGPLRCLGPV